MRTLLTSLLLLACGALHAQGFSRVYPTAGNSAVCGLQNGDLLWLFNTSTVATATRITATGAVVWSQDFAPNLDNIWDPHECANGEILCLVHVADSLNPGTFINGIMRMTSTGEVIRLRAFTDLDISGGCPSCSHLVLHNSDDSYHYVYQPSLLNDCRTHYMNADDEVITALESTNGTLPVISMVERDGYLYGVHYQDIWKAHYNGDPVWWARTTGSNRFFYQIMSHDTDLVARFQSGAGAGNYRPGIARMDTTGHITHEVVFDKLGTGDLNAELVRTDEGFMLFSSYQANNPTVYEVYAFSCDAQLENPSALEDDFAYSMFQDADATPNNGVVLCGSDNTVSDAFLTSTGPGHDLSLCWNSVSIDTLALPAPVWNEVLQLPVTVPSPTALRSAPSVPYDPGGQVSCVALGVHDALPMDDVQVWTDASGVHVLSPTHAIARCELFDALGRVVNAARGDDQALHMNTATLTSAVCVLRVHMSDGSVVTRSLVLFDR